MKKLIEKLKNDDDFADGLSIGAIVLIIVIALL